MIESILQGIDGVVIYLDNILITGASKEAHLTTIDEVLSSLDRAGLRVKKSKCEFMKSSVTDLGHRIDADGLHPLPDRVRVIKEAPIPNSVSQLKSYLGMLTYFTKFLPYLSTLLLLCCTRCMSCLGKMLSGNGVKFKTSHSMSQRTSLFLKKTLTPLLILPWLATHQLLVLGLYCRIKCAMAQKSP